MSEPKGAINVYRCRDCGKPMVTINRDEGVTPFLKDCAFCMRGTAQSSMYPEWAQKLPPEFEWYRQTEEEARAEDVTYPGSFQHWQGGGLAFRPIDPNFETDRNPRGPNYLVVHRTPNRKARRAAAARKALRS